MNKLEEFTAECEERISQQADNDELQRAARLFLLETIKSKYSYNFSWLSRPVIQYPQDIVSLQELIWKERPDLIVETGIAHGGSLILSASMLALLDYADAVASGEVLDPKKPRRRVLGIDIDIRSHNRAAIEAHPFAGRIDMIQGSAIDPPVIERVREMAAPFKRVLVCLDSNHTHDHVLAELEAYAPLVSRGSYCIVFDTVIEELPADMYPDRPWRPGHSPMSALDQYLKILSEDGRVATDGRPLRFERDQKIDNQLLVSAAPQGYLRRVG
jgi:cephalosporin hydroxylase